MRETDIMSRTREKNIKQGIDEKGEIVDSKSHEYSGSEEVDDRRLVRKIDKQ